MLNKKIIALAVLSLLQATSVHADTANMNELQNINTEIILLEANLKKKELQEKIDTPSAAEKADKEAEMPKTILPSVMPSAFQSTQIAPKKPIDTVIIKSIESYGTKKIAIAHYQGGALFQVSKGDFVTPEWRVIKINSSSVTVKRKNKTKTLVVGYSPPKDNNANLSNGMMPGAY